LVIESSFMHFGRYVIQSKTKPLNGFHLLHLALAITFI
jgi:hypothetical protein